ncbi:MAG: PAS domain-containing protein [Sphingobacteriales bacterium]|nr:PAS domain-containing protein [Sphingobacteriales bacterium]
MLEVSSEIIELEKKLEELEAKCAFLQKIMNEVPANIYITELDKGVVWCNKTNEQTLGYTLEDIQRMGGINYLYEVVHPDDYNVPDKSVNHFVNHPEQQYGGVFRCKHRQSNFYKWFIGWGKVIQESKGEKTKLQVLNVDVDLSPQMDTDKQIRAILAENLKLQHRFILETLTKREVEILKMICRGASSKEIAKGLYISKYTVETHRKNLQKKIGTTNIASLVLFSKETGLV